MRNLLALIGALVVGFGGLGWYLGWYKLNFNRNPQGNLEIKTDVDTGRVAKDTGNGLKQIGTFFGSKLEQAVPDAKGGQPAAPPVNTPGPATTPSSSPEPGNTVLGFDFSKPDGGK